MGTDLALALRPLPTQELLELGQNRRTSPIARTTAPQVDEEQATWANDAPMQRRTPPPNGIHAYDSAPPSRNRSGLNSCGDS